MLNEQTITIPAKSGNQPGKTVQNVNGRVFVCISTTGEFKVQPSGAGKLTMSAGRKYGTPTGKRFSSLTFFNYTALTITATYYAGDIDYDSASTNVTASVSNIVKDAPTYTKAHNDISLSAGETWTFTGLDGTKQRKQISVANGDAALVLYIQDGDALTGQFVQPGQPWSQVTNGIIKVKNPNGSTMAVAVLETFYQ
jgi:hypothetical protein